MKTNEYITLEKEGLIKNENLALIKEVQTHARKAHADDMYVCGLIKALMDVPIRRKSTVAVSTLKNVEVCVVDVGEKYNKVFNNYDHHQKDPAVQGETALSLFIRDNVPFLLKDTKVKSLVTRINSQDNGGFRATRKDLGVSYKAAQGFLFGEFGLTALFATNPNKIANIVKDFWIDKITFPKQVKLCREWLQGEYVRRDVYTKNGTLIKILEIPRQPPFPSAIINKAQTKAIDDGEIDLCVGFDLEEVGKRTLFRTYHGEAKGIDLREIEDSKTFSHSRGFLFSFYQDGDIGSFLERVINSLNC